MCECKRLKNKKVVRYCGDTLECSGIKKGDSFNTVVEKLDEAVCNSGGGDNCDLNVDIQFNENTMTATSFVVGGTAPYTYEWKYPQNIFRGNYEIVNPTLNSIVLEAETFCDFLESDTCVVATGDGGNISQPSFFVPMYLTLKVKDSLGCVGYSSYMAYVPFRN